jgi:hypothetical protein
LYKGFFHSKSIRKVGLFYAMTAVFRAEKEKRKQKTKAFDKRYGICYNRKVG